MRLCRAAFASAMPVASVYVQRMNPDYKKLALRAISYVLKVLTATNCTATAAGGTNWLSQASFEPPLVMAGVKADSGMNYGGWDYRIGALQPKPPPHPKCAWIHALSACSEAYFGRARGCTGGRSVRKWRCRRRRQRCRSQCRPMD